MTSPIQLSIVIPSYNAAEWLPSTIAHAVVAISASPWATSAEIIVVDDGSTDDTARALDSLSSPIELRVIRQQNQGRFGARLRGVEAARGELIFLLDSRVWVHDDALAFVGEQLAADPSARVWNGDVEIPGHENPYARFWFAVTRIAWRRYFSNRTTTSFGARDFDYYPKGTGCFIVPRESFLHACKEFDSHFEDLRHSNDDTAVIRFIAERERVHISPQFMCTYHSREDLRGFLTHAHHRGIHFVDGYVRPGNRYFVPFLVLAAVSPALAVWVVRRPRSAIAGMLIGTAGIGIAANRLGTGRKNAAAFAGLTPAFSVAYGSGIVRGLYLMARKRMQ